MNLLIKYIRNFMSLLRSNSRFANSLLPASILISMLGLNYILVFAAAKYMGMVTEAYVHPLSVVVWLLAVGHVCTRIAISRIKSVAVSTDPHNSTDIESSSSIKKRA